MSDSLRTKIMLYIVVSLVYSNSLLQCGLKKTLFFEENV